MRLESLSLDEAIAGRRPEGPRPDRGGLAGVAGRPDLRLRPRRQQRGGRGRRRESRLADQRRRRRFDLPGDVRAVPPAARGSGASTSSRGATCARSTPCSRSGEMLALLIDWGYRSDGVPVRLFGAWTTLPAGPATLAAKTSSVILPVAIRRGDDGHVPRLVLAGDHRAVGVRGRHRAGHPGRSPTRSGRRSPPRPSSGTASSRCGRRPTRRPPSSRRARNGCWPAPRGPTGRAAARHATTADGDDRSRVRRRARRPAARQDPASRHRRDRVPATRRGRRAARGTPGQRARVLALRALSWVACRLPERVAIGLADVVGWLWYRAAPGVPPRPAGTSGRVAAELDRRGSGSPRAPRGGHATRARWNGSSAWPSATTPATTSRSSASRA